YLPGDLRLGSFQSFNYTVLQESRNSTRRCLPLPTRSGYRIPERSCRARRTDIRLPVFPELLFSKRGLQPDPLQHPDVWDQYRFSVSGRRPVSGGEESPVCHLGSRVQRYGSENWLANV